MKIHLWTLLLTSLVVLSFSCDHSHSHSHPHGSGGQPDEPEPNTHVVTVWEEGIEAFVEFEYPVKDEEVRFITHIAYTENGKPRTEGPITFEFTHENGKVLSQKALKDPKSLEHPARAGIYLPKYKFDLDGLWSAKLKVPLADGDVRTVQLPEFRVYISKDDAKSVDAPEEADGVSFLKEQQWLISTITVPASHSEVSEQRTFPGHIHEKVGKRVLVSSPVQGKLTMKEGFFPDRGTPFKAGEVIAWVQPILPTSDLLSLIVKVAEVDAQLQQAQQTLELAQLNLARAEKLRQSDAIALRDYDKAKYEEKAAQVALKAATSTKASYQEAMNWAKSLSGENAAESKKGLSLIPITASIDGTLIEIKTAPGEVVNPDQPLFIILDTSIVTVEARITQHEAEDIPSKPIARLKLDEGYNDQEDNLPLKLFYSGLEIEEDTHTIPLLYEAENKDGLLRVGMVCEVLMEVAEPKNVLSVPYSALVDEDGSFVVFVQVSGETFQKRNVELGIRGETQVEVLSGLKDGERVVVTNPWAIRLASLSTVIPAHEH